MDWQFLKTSLCLLVLLLMVAGGCQKDNIEDPANATPTTEKKLHVVATISMITDILKNIGQDRIDVTGIVGEGVDPHLYKPTAGDTERLKDADIIFYNGLYLEAKIIGTVLDKMADKTKAVAVTAGTLRSQLRTSPEFQGGYDPHVWHDVSLWMKAVEKIRDTLAQADPNNAEYYRSNAKNYLATLKTLHEDLQNLATQIPAQRRVLVTTHDAFGYFGRAYGFKVRGLQGLNTETEVGVADVRENSRRLLLNIESRQCSSKPQPRRGASRLFKPLFAQKGSRSKSAAIFSPMRWERPELLKGRISG